MTIDSTLLVQAALYGRLRADPGLNALVGGRIYDHVPAQTSYPYLMIGETMAKTFDTQDLSGYDIVTVFHVYSRLHGMEEIDAVLSSVHTALHGANFVVMGHRLLLCQHLEAATEKRTETDTRHGWTRFRLITVSE